MGSFPPAPDEWNGAPGAPGDIPVAPSPLPDWVQEPVVVESRPQYRIAYIRHIGPYFGNTCRIPEALTRIERWAKVRGLWTGNEGAVGMCPDNSLITPPGLCVYDAGICIPDGVSEDDTVSIRTIPAGRYAVLRAKCQSREMENVWGWLTSVWFPASGLVREIVPSYEYYRTVPGQPISPENGVELCVRLRSP